MRLKEKLLIAMIGKNGFIYGTIFLYLVSSLSFLTFMTISYDIDGIGHELAKLNTILGVTLAIIPSMFIASWTVMKLRRTAKKYGIDWTDYMEG